MRNNIIAYWTSNSHIINCLESINKKLKIELLNINCAEDLIAVPGFINIIDSYLLTEKLLIGLNPFVKHWDKNENIILVVGKKFKIEDFEISKYFKFISETADEQTLIGIIKYRMNQKTANRKENILKSKIYRITFIYDALRRDVPVRTEDLCDIFDVSERTIRRDFKILSEVLDEKIHYDRDFGFFLNS
ncbi:MAG: DeoR family transcriptional regulator [Bacteroidales bacterium]|jgi:hypothetical protein|nr:DeoR family transcriptional regulator [Bacteroidales bacterium]MDD4575418.1 DeoR family transcriptional regulator [Bacteroidales bacterium]MDY0388362.1 DeoR family transcriptional regulator [Methanolobus sp.]